MHHAIVSHRRIALGSIIVVEVVATKLTRIRDDFDSLDANTEETRSEGTTRVVAGSDIPLRERRTRFEVRRMRIRED
jgi:hypothetical protein